MFSDGTNLKKMRVPDGAPEIVANDAGHTVGWRLERQWHPSLCRGQEDFRSVRSSGGRRSSQANRSDRTAGGRVRLGRSSFRAARISFSLLAAGGIEESDIYLATLRDGRAADPVLLMKNATAARYTPAGGGRILFVRNDNLYAQRLNRTARKLEGEPELVQQRCGVLARVLSRSLFCFPYRRGGLASRNGRPVAGDHL